MSLVATSDGRHIQLATWAIITTIVILDILWISATDYEFSYKSATTAFIGVATLSPLLWFYSRRRPDQKIAESLSAVLALLVFTAGGAPLSYLVAGLNLPLWDETLHAWDNSLGLDWRAYLEWVNARPTLGRVLSIAYATLIPQMLCICLILGFTARFQQLRQFTFCVVTSGFICIVVSGLVPAMAMYVELGLQPSDFPNLSPAAAYVHVDHLQQLRSGEFRVLELDSAQGIITFPSYHASLAIIFAAALWSVPLLRWSSIVLNVTVLAATPIDGGHYFVDVLAGIVVAVICVSASIRGYLPGFAWNGKPQWMAPKTALTLPSFPGVSSARTSLFASSSSLADRTIERPREQHL